MELALVFGIAMVLALRASMVDAAGDGGTASEDEGERGPSLRFLEIAQGTFEVYTLDSRCASGSTTPEAWIHSEFDAQNPGNPYREYWLFPNPVLVEGPAGVRLLFEPTTKASNFSPPSGGTPQQVRTAFITYAGPSTTGWNLHVHQIQRA